MYAVDDRVRGAQCNWFPSEEGNFAVAYRYPKTGTSF
jgi:hypothetical protein